MIRPLARTVAAELVKLGGLPCVLAAGLGTVAAAAVLAAALAAAPPATVGAEQIVTGTVEVLQVGPIVIGVLAAGTEYEGRQIVTTLVATPSRSPLLAGKSLACLLVVTVTSAVAVTAGLATARVVAPAAGQAGPWWPAAGAAVYLALIGLLSFELAVLLRSLLAPLVGMLSLVLIVSPLVSGYTEHARWLPGRAGRLLYLPGADTVLGPVEGGLVLVAWIVLTAAGGLAGFLSRDSGAR
jgi:ABC-2 type transport system permease protein